MNNKILEHLNLCDERIEKGGELYETADTAEEIVAARDEIDYWIKQRGYLIEQLKTEKDVEIKEFEKIMAKQNALVNIMKAMPIGVVLGEVLKQNRFISAMMNEKDGYMISSNTKGYM